MIKLMIINWLLVILKFSVHKISLYLKTLFKLHFITFQYQQEIVASGILRELFAAKLFKKKKNPFKNFIAKKSSYGLWRHLNKSEMTWDLKNLFKNPVHKV